MEKQEGQIKLGVKSKQSCGQYLKTDGLTSFLNVSLLFLASSLEVSASAVFVEN